MNALERMKFPNKSSLNILVEVNPGHVDTISILLLLLLLVLLVVVGLVVSRIFCNSLACKTWANLLLP